MAPTDRWARTLRRAARVAIWALPAYAVMHLWPAVRPAPDPAADPVAWAAEVTSADYLRAQVGIGLGGQLLGLIALVALAALLTGARSRRWAGAGLLAGLAAAVLLLPRQGLAVFAAPALGQQVREGNLVAARGYEQAYGSGGLLLLAGAGLLTLAWLLLAVAVYRSGVLGRGDGVLLALAAPLVGLASGYLPVVVPLGALLLLAAGIGIAWSCGRLVPSGDPP